MTDETTLTVALAGNPNVGKSTLFNALTGRAQRTGNWPGKTVERATGQFTAQGRTIQVVDLPGTYSLAAQSPEEIIARDYIAQEEPDVVMVIVDATKLERNLNLTLQILELTDQVVVALNFMDEVKREGWRLDAKGLEAALGVPVVPIVAVKREGVQDATDAMLEVADGSRATNPTSVDYGLMVEKHLTTLQADLSQAGVRRRSRYLALKLLEDDPQIAHAFQQGSLPPSYASDGDPQARVPPEALRRMLQRAVRLREASDPDAKVEIVRRRYQLAHEIVHRVVHRPSAQAGSLTERVDEIVTHKVWAWPIMVAMLGGLVWMTIAGAEVGGQWLAVPLLWLVEIVRQFLRDLGAPWWLEGSLVDGALFSAVTVTILMLPPMVILFTVFDILQDLGFVPRVAFNLDRIMRAVGSQGKHVLALTMSLGCNVTGVLSTRVIENEKDRLTAIITSSLVVCSGRLGAGSALAMVLFRDRAVPVMFSLVLLSVVSVLAATFILNKTVFRHEPQGFVMELPPYRRPDWRTIAQRSLIDEVGRVMLKAVEFAVPAGALIWVLGNTPGGASFEHTPMGSVVAWLSPLGAPLGLTGEMLAALLFGLPAKEIVPPLLAMTHGVQTTLAETPQVMLGHIAQGWSPLVSLSFMVFFMLYLPCLVTAWAAWKETRSTKWMGLVLAVPLATATLVTLLLYQGGRLLGL